VGDQWFGNFVLNDNDEPVRAGSFMEWALWMGDNPERRQLCLDKIGATTVSTVFLGIDFGYSVHQRAYPKTPALPRLWETMIFDETGGPYDEYQRRYTSKKDALEGHRKAVQMLTS